MQEQLFNQAHRHSNSHTLNTTPYTQEHPQETLNRCIRLKAPANTHSQKSLDKQPQGNNFQNFSLPLLTSSATLVPQINQTYCPDPVPGGFSLSPSTISIFLHLSFFIDIYLSTPNTLLPHSHYGLPLVWLNCIA